MTTIPCKRPKVDVEPVAGLDLYVGRCRVPGCAWTEGPSVKTYIAERATHHRREHRAAVPTFIDDPILDVLGRVQQPGTKCSSCDWRTPSTCNTKADVKFLTEDHLIHVHGLVTC